ncbi:MAG: type II secretion system F family protein [Pseudomonadota bacterium]
MNWIIQPQNLLVVFITVAAFATVLAVVSPILYRDPLKGRMKSVALERDKMRERERARLQAAAKDGDKRASLRSEQKAFFQKFVDAFDLRKRLDDGTTANKLLQAGKRSPSAILVFLTLRVLLPFGFAAAVAFYMYVILPDLLPANQKVLAICAGAALGFYGPNIWLTNTISKRQQSIKRAWPDALDLMLICVESGMSIEAALKKVSEEVGQSSVPLAEELLLTNAELSYLQERRQAYENLSKRTGLDVVKAVVTSLIQAEKYGTPLGTALRVLAQENRDMRMMEAEKKAASLPPKLTVPMILFFLPCLFIVIITPAYIKISESGATPS